MEATCTMTFSSITDVMLLVPNHGGAVSSSFTNFSAGGGLFFVQGLPANLSSLTTTNTILVIGCGIGTSYYNPTYITSLPTILINSATSQTHVMNTTVLNPNYVGYFEFTLI